MIHQAIAIINDSLSLLGGVCYGISTPIITVDEDKISVIPIEVTNNLSCKYPDLNDSNKVTIYHRIMRKTYSSDTKGYGDGKRLIVTYDMRLICFGIRRLFKVTPEEVEHNVVAMIPNKVGKSTITIVQSDFDSNKLFSEEFRNVDNFISTSNFLFAVNYQVSMPYNSHNCLTQTL